jgi:dihydrofolate reductase
MKISLIVAVDSEGGIGKNNQLLWHLPNDMKFFKETTLHHIVLMGRKNFESIPEKFRPLPNRLNCILTKNPLFHADNCLVFNDLQTCLAQFQDDTRTLFIIGGGEIYRLAMDQLDITEMFITKVHHAFDADTHFPSFVEENWHREKLHRQVPDDRHAYGFTVYRYSR